MNYHFADKMRITCLENFQQLATQLASRILHSAKQAIQQRGAFHCVLAGGSTPQRAYALLQGADTDWSKWFLYLGDERVLPQGDKERNSTLLEKNWLQKLPKPQPNWHPIPTELGMDAAVMAYTQTLAAVEKFDLVLLGMGEDGHTASLFPAHEHPDGVSVHAVINAPKAPSERVSLSRERLCQTHEMLIIVSGEGKRLAMQQWLAGADLPITQVTHLAVKRAKLELLIDKSAWPNAIKNK